MGLPPDKTSTAVTGAYTWKGFHRCMLLRVGERMAVAIVRAIIGLLVAIVEFSCQSSRKYNFAIRL